MEGGVNSKPRGKLPIFDAELSMKTPTKKLSRHALDHNQSRNRLRKMNTGALILIQEK
jgi:hypothetical protein